MRINPINFHQRVLTQLPPHFVNTVIRANEHQMVKIEKWIYENCKGRYSVTKDVVNDNGNTKNVIVLGFEEPSDLTLFAISGIAQNNQN